MNLIPYPSVWKPKEGHFALGANVAVKTETELGALGALGASEFDSVLKGLPETAQKGTIVLKRDESLPEEGYRLEIEENSAVVSASSESGFFYAAQSVRMLAEADVKGKPNYRVACGIVEDAPRFSYRGVLFDDCRHFFGKDVVKRMIDRMAKLKLNTLHWHLNDDQGWRVEIDAYPLLTEIGSKRRESQIGGGQSNRFNGIPVSGFYSKDDIREIVAYARTKCVKIVPEIDMPGHFTAVLAAYPELSCTEEPIEVRTRFGISELIACGGKEEVYRFAENVLKEIAELFPDRFVHIGGDEAPKKYWDDCPRCAKKREELGLKDSHELQSYFTNRMVAFLKGLGKETIGWNEALRGKGLDKSFIAEYWTPVRDKRTEEYFASGGRIVFAKFQPFYLDYTYAQHPLRLTYDFERFLKPLDPSAKNFLGIEGTLWSEWIEDERKLEFQAFPRLTALAESAWSVRKTGYRDFVSRLESFRTTLSAWGIQTVDLAFYNPKNPVKRLFRYAVWGLKDPDCEYKIFLKKEKIGR